MEMATDTDMAPEQERQSQDQACQTDWIPTATVSIKTQTGKQLTKTQSKACQLTPEMLTASLPVPGRQRKLKVHGTRDPATPDQPPQAASSSSSSSSSQHQLEDAPSSSPAAPPSVSSDWELSPISAADSSDKSDLSESREAFGDEICHKEPKYIVFGSSLGKLPLSILRQRRHPSSVDNHWNTA
ncbi:hypothetical protein NQZ68_024310 [Dissostichus eleginoides]|nr:hypothetical protein NQZ68_024310 [Dissostichus eleginoides]